MRLAFAHLRAPSKLARYAMAGWLPGGTRLCSVCNHRVWRFMPYRMGRKGTPPLMRALAVVGSDVENFECPRCGAHDRERHLFLYMRARGVLDALRGARILHFAPERRLAGKIQAFEPAEYVKGDLFPAAPDIVKVDMQSMQFADGTFDLVIANHVLEHVEDVAAALGEVVRVLVPGGMAILQTPFSSALESTWRDAGIRTADARLQAYGQEDHARLFGRDIWQQVADAGLEFIGGAHGDLLADVDPDRSGVNAEEPFFLFRKPPPGAAHAD